MAHVTVLPSGWPDTVGAIVLRISAFSEFINIRDTQPTYARGSKRFKCALCFATPSHWSGPGWTCSSFPVWLFHSLLHAGLSRRYPGQRPTPYSGKPQI